MFFEHAYWIAGAVVLELQNCSERLQTSFSIFQKQKNESKKNPH